MLLKMEPLLPSQLPDFAEKVTEYIHSRALKYLPNEQFTGRQSTERLEHFVEIGGFLAIDNEEVTEINYSGPNVKAVCRYLDITVGRDEKPSYVPEDIARSKFKVEKSPRVKIVSNSFKQIPANLEEFDTIIDWHTHPFVDETEDDFDVDGAKEIADSLDTQSYFMVIYKPVTNTHSWYKLS